MDPRFSARLERRTQETEIVLELRLDGQGRCRSASGVPFLDHLIGALVKHAGLDLELTCRGDLQIDDHHTVEDCALALGQALSRALGERAGRLRFGSAYAPLDEALARAVIDLSGRPFAAIELDLRQERLGTLSTQNATHFLESFANAAGAALHVDVIRGKNDHHKAEAAFKAVALALRQALDWRREALDQVPSTKGVLLESRP